MTICLNIYTYIIHKLILYITWSLNIKITAPNVIFAHPLHPLHPLPEIYVEIVALAI